MVRPTLLVTDFAGTTLRDDGTVLSAYRSVLSARGIPFTDADLAARRGASKRVVFEDLAARVERDPETRRNLAAAALADFEAAVRRAYEQDDLHEVDGAQHAMRVLRDAGIQVALSSGFDRGLVDTMLARLGWQTLFATVVGADDVPVGRPSPFLIYRAMMELKVLDVATVAVVGDTTLDLRSATNARAGWAIGVLSGAHDLPALGAEAHTHVLPSVAALPALFGLHA